MKNLFLLILCCAATQVSLLLAGDAFARKNLRDIPVVWHENDRADIEEPAEREPSIVWD